ncbi:MAG: hypothetical protein FWD58_03875 [Firmicutes bacterium]|nr:hypothetical protein [Bacillota bacterium]
MAAVKVAERAATAESERAAEAALGYCSQDTPAARAATVTPQFFIKRRTRTWLF